MMTLWPLAKKTRCPPSFSVGGSCLPATPKQIKLLTRLAREKGQWIETLTDLTMGEASSKIEELMAV